MRLFRETFKTFVELYQLIANQTVEDGVLKLMLS